MVDITIPVPGLNDTSWKDWADSIHESVLAAAAQAHVDASIAEVSQGIQAAIDAAVGGFRSTTKVTIQWTGLKWSQPRPSVTVCPAGMAEYVSQLHEDAPWPHDDPTSGILAGDIVERHPSAPGPA